MNLRQIFLNSLQLSGKKAMFFLNRTGMDLAIIYLSLLAALASAPALASPISAGLSINLVFYLIYFFIFYYLPLLLMLIFLLAVAALSRYRRAKSAFRHSGNSLFTPRHIRPSSVQRMHSLPGALQAYCMHFPSPSSCCFWKR